jgi:hypothetical protein
MDPEMHEDEIISLAWYDDEDLYDQVFSESLAEVLEDAKEYYDLDYDDDPNPYHGDYFEDDGI